MAYPYGSAAGVRRQHARITSTLISDEGITTILENDVDKPIIDTMLYGRITAGATQPEVIKLISNMLGAAAIHEQRLSHTDNESRWAKLKREAAMELLQKVVDGEIQASGISDPVLMVMTDPEADRPATEIYTGSETEWAERTETREG